MPPFTPTSAVPAHQARTRRSATAQPKLGNRALAPHPATVSRSVIAQPKLTGSRAPHPATVPRRAAVQPKLASALAPHPATVPRSRSRAVAQRSSVNVDGIESKLTRYGHREMAGNCVNSAQEVGKALEAKHGADNVRYVAIVYGDGSGAARNHIAAAFLTQDGPLVVDATWKQFPFLQNRIAEVSQEPWLRTFSPEDWQQMVAEYTPGMRDAVFTTKTTLEQARQWMKERIKEVPTFAPVTGNAKASRGCTLL